MEKNTILRGVKRYNQVSHNLCWAACLQTIIHFHQPDVFIDQYQIVAKKFAQQKKQDVFDEKTGLIKPAFDRALSKAELVALVADYDFKIDTVSDKAQYWHIITQEINNNRPLIANTGFHYVVILGYNQSEIGEYIICHNPKHLDIRIEKFVSCGKMKIDSDLLLISPKDRDPQYLQAVEASFQEVDSGVETEQKQEWLTQPSIQLVTKVINITKEHAINIDLDLPPCRCDVIVGDRIIQTFEICNGHWRALDIKIKSTKKPIKFVVINDRTIELDNTSFNALHNASILPFTANDNAVQFEKIVFQPFIFQFYHIKLTHNSNNQDFLIPVRDYTINRKSYKQGMAVESSIVIADMLNEFNF